MPRLNISIQWMESRRQSLRLMAPTQLRRWLMSRQGASHSQWGQMSHARQYSWGDKLRTLTTQTKIWNLFLSQYQKTSYPRLLPPLKPRDLGMFFQPLEARQKCTLTMIISWLDELLSPKHHPRNLSCNTLPTSMSSFLTLKNLK